MIKFLAFLFCEAVTALSRAISFPFLLILAALESIAETSQAIGARFTPED